MQQCMDCGMLLVIMLLAVFLIYIEPVPISKSGASSTETPAAAFTEHPTRGPTEGPKSDPRDDHTGSSDTPLEEEEEQCPPTRIPAETPKEYLSRPLRYMA